MNLPTDKVYYACPANGNYIHPSSDQTPYLSEEAFRNSFDAYIRPLKETHGVVFNEASVDSFAKLTPLKLQLNTRLVMDFRDLKNAGVIDDHKVLDISSDHGAWGGAIGSERTLLGTHKNSVPYVFSVNDALPKKEAESLRDFSSFMIHEDIHQQQYAGQLFGKRLAKQVPSEISLDDFYSTVNLNSRNEDLNYISSNLKFLAESKVADFICDRHSKKAWNKTVEATAKALDMSTSQVNRRANELLTDYGAVEPAERFTTLYEANASLKMNKEGFDPELAHELGLSKESYETLVEQVKKPVSEADELFIKTLTRFNTKHSPVLRKPLETLDTKWTPIKKVMLQWHSKPRDLKSAEEFALEALHEVASKYKNIFITKKLP